MDGYESSDTGPKVRPVQPEPQGQEGGTGKVPVNASLPKYQTTQAMTHREHRNNIPAGM